MFGIRPVFALLLLPLTAPLTVPPVVTITFRDYAFDAPSTLPAGATTFHAVNAGKEPHHGLLVRLAPGKTVAELAAALAKPGPPPSWITMLGGPQQGSVVTLDLTPGNYAWICMVPGPDGAPHVMKGMIKGFVVTPNKAPAPMPAAEITASMKDYGWDFSKPLTAGKHTVKFITAPGQPHELVIWKLAPGKTESDLATWATKMDSPPPGTVVGGVSPMQAGTANVVTLDLPPGHYAFFCFLPDAKDGKEHFHHGMMQDVTLR
ncbi:MAG: hypothetical protein ABJC19_08075 [Gemmatimonadota bacterium]